MSFNLFYDEDTEVVTTEVLTETTTELPDAIIIEPWQPQYSDIQFIPEYDEETSEYSSVVVDNRPYMSSEVINADINDVYTMVLSIRNVVLLWFLVWLLLKFKTMIHNVTMKYMEGRK